MIKCVSEVNRSDVKVNEEHQLFHSFRTTSFTAAEFLHKMRGIAKYQ